MTTSNGAPILNKNDVLTTGVRGTILMQDVVFMDEMAHFDRERIPARVVHAKRAGAHGYFEVIHDITKYCKADLFSKIGKQTPLFLRFSTVKGEMASADTVRDLRGFALKFYTEEGNWDLVGNNSPIFFILDPILFPNFIHTQKRNHQTHLKDANAAWEFFSLRPETLHQMMHLFSDRVMHGFGSDTFKMINAEGVPVYVNFHFKTKEGIKSLKPCEATRIGEDPDFYIRVGDEHSAENCPFNAFDVTKIWPKGEYPLIPVGKLVLNKNPLNYFAEVEQAAFCPAHIPGIEFSPDRMLQVSLTPPLEKEVNLFNGRIFSYNDAHFHRLGPNKNQLPINCPFRSRAFNTQRDGVASYNNQGAAVNYHPNSINGPQEVKCAKIVGDRIAAGDYLNFDQPRVFREKILCEEGRKNLVANIVDGCHCALPFITDRLIQNFEKVHPDFASMTRKALEEKRKCTKEEKHASSL
ncbi:hypothetical protein PRIPAC_76940 [Pristionchus pacificus]|uniref:Catalase domain-containing protein n=1 Tax=Pristionchus pacificus TaxID=54126 RepID=A0A2A6BDU3_PRIPA|nr:hypothetical protein PRIPAC_76940 [Pristionchus pacificus]|eukprot:PDM64052.1 hypothetical protein PRIPAC_54296 [Pristionchus pacificus]